MYLHTSLVDGGDGASKRAADLSCRWVVVVPLWPLISRGDGRVTVTTIDIEGDGVGAVDVEGSGHGCYGHQC